MSFDILLTGFSNTSSEQLLRFMHSYDTLLLPSDKLLDSAKIIRAMSEKHYRLVICFGQKPNLKNKLSIETTARDAADVVQTTMDCRQLASIFCANGVPACLSHNAGTSFCNAVYLNGLRHIAAQDMNTQLVFVHIPFEKNIREPSVFYRRIRDVIDILRCEGGIP